MDGDVKQGGDDGLAIASMVTLESSCVSIARQVYDRRRWVCALRVARSADGPQARRSDDQPSVGSRLG